VLTLICRNDILLVHEGKEAKTNLLQMIFEN